MAITKEQILAAADQIAATGERPTLEAVRQITRGSFTTISPVLNEWKARQKEATAPMREPAPQALGERLAEVGADIWAMALAMANSRLAAERESLKKARADMETTQAEAAELADKLASEVDALQSRLASLETAEQAARIEADELRGQLATAQEKAHTAEARAVEIERRASELRTELDRAHQEADQVRGSLTELLQKEQTVRQDTEADAYKVRADVARLVAELAVSERHAAEIEARGAESARVAEQAAQAQLKNMTREIEALREAKSKAESRALKAAEDAAELRGRLAAAMQQENAKTRTKKPG